MPDLTRRDLLRAAAIGSAFTLLPASIRKALAIPANNRTGTLRDVEHVVILMQENRSFDCVRLFGLKTSPCGPALKRHRFIRWGVTSHYRWTLSKERP